MNTPYVPTEQELEGELSLLKEKLVKAYLMPIERHLASEEGGLEVLQKLQEYREKIELSGDINPAVSGTPLIHFLTELYHRVKNANIEQYIRDFISDIPAGYLGLNSLDRRGYTVLMQVFGYERELREKSKYHHVDEQIRKLQQIATLIEERGGTITYTREQQVIADEVDGTPGIYVIELSKEMRERVLRAYTVH